MTHSSSAPSQHGEVTAFLFPELSIRGALLQVNEGWSAWRRQRNYPDTVATLLGQAMAAAPLLAASLKFEGKLSLQAEGDGAVPMLIVQASHSLEVRGMARFTAEIGGAANPSLFGTGRLGMILEPDGPAGDPGKRYETLVPLSGNTLAECLALYFSQSEQLATRLQLAADSTRLGGILLQKMPTDTGEKDTDDWPRLTALLETLTEDELLGLAPEPLLRRLFHEEAMALFDPRPVALLCRCSHARTSALLLGMGETDVQSILEEQGKVEIDCGFCGARYEYSPSDVEQLFSAEQAVPDTGIRH